MASPNQDIGPIAALLNLIDQTTIAIWVVVIAPLIAFGRWVWGIRRKDLERMSATEQGVARALERISSLQTDHNEFKVHIREYQEALAEKPNREEIMRRLDAIPHQVAMLLGHRRD